MSELVIIGGGLAGSEAAWQAANRGVRVKLYEMRPDVQTGAHVGSDLGELVCSNSLGSDMRDRAPGLLKYELRRLNSLLIEAAEETKVPAGSALAVDREKFSELVTQKILAHPLIDVIRQEVRHIPDQVTIIASGPLTSPGLSQAIAEQTGDKHLYFFDAISPIVSLDSIDFNIAFRASRFGRGDQVEGDYINCPMDGDEYASFVDALIAAERIELRDFELELEDGVKAGAASYFEGCLPIEVLAKRGRDALAYGPMRPVGLVDPRTGRRPYAVLQLRQDNLAGTLYNMVGFQTNLKFPEQRRVFRLIPGLSQAEFARYGQMHRNTFILSPKLLLPTLQSKTRRDLFYAGQITGVEGYAGNIATGLLAGLNAVRVLKRMEPVVLPRTTMVGALSHYITHASEKDFQPMKANFGLLELEGEGKRIRGKRARAAYKSARALEDLDKFIKAQGGLL